MPTEINQQEARRRSIRALLRERKLRTQTELVAQLEALGHTVTQSSVSRDLREMQVVKNPDGYVLPEDAPSSVDSRFDYVRQIAAAGANLLVVKTAIGAAQRVAVELDRTDWPEIIGTISGDDTIFIATAGHAANRRLASKLQPLNLDADHG